MDRTILTSSSSGWCCSPLEMWQFPCWNLSQSNIHTEHSHLLQKLSSLFYFGLDMTWLEKLFYSLLLWTQGAAVRKHTSSGIRCQRGVSRSFRPAKSLRFCHAPIKTLTLVKVFILWTLCHWSEKLFKLCSFILLQSEPVCFLFFFYNNHWHSGTLSLKWFLYQWTVVTVYPTGFNPGFIIHIVFIETLDAAGNLLTWTTLIDTNKLSVLFAPLSQWTDEEFPLGDLVTFTYRSGLKLGSMESSTVTLLVK